MSRETCGTAVHGSAASRARVGTRRLGMLAAAAVALAGAAFATPAQASVELAQDTVTVRGQGAGAQVTRRPFRITYTDGDGQPVLRQVANEHPAPFPAAPIPDPQTGLKVAAQPTLYSPMTVTVGRQRSVQDAGGIYQGNILTGVEGGVTYAAGDVLQAQAEGDGVRMLVSTNDPTGRRLAVTIAPARDGALRVSVRPTPDDGVAAVADAFETAADEAFHGFGGRHNAIDQRGQDLYSWLTETNYSAGPLQPAFDAAPQQTGGKTYLFPNGPTAAYYPQPLMVSSRPYGFLLERSELARFRMASDRPDAWQVSAAAGALDYVVAPGPAARAIGSLTAITGRHRVPPDWALGPMSTESIQAGDLTGDGDEAAARVEEDIRELDRNGVALTGFDIEAWSFMSRERLKSIIAALQRRGIVPTLYFTPFLSATADREAIERGYSVKTATGQPYLYTSPFGVLSLVDFTNPEAVRWWQDRVRAALDLGADGFMQDWGEQVLVDMHFADGSSGASMHNRYPVLYHRATRALTDRYERAHPGRRIFFYTRSGYTDRPGAAASESANFPGDEHADWSRSNGIASLTTDMLSRGIGGNHGFTTDIGGYLDTYGKTSDELMQRWTQWAALSPMFRIHNNVGAGTVQPWEFSTQTLAVYKRYAALRNRALPLVRTLWAQAEATGMPIARPLWLEHPGDAEAARQDQEWQLGPDVLVAPVVEQGATSREVYFPRGCWEHGDSGQRFAGPRSERVAAPADSLPYFVRCGTDPFLAAAAGAARPARRCASRRTFRIRLPRGRRSDRLTFARVLVDGRVVRACADGDCAHRSICAAFRVDASSCRSRAGRAAVPSCHRHASIGRA